MLAYGLNWLAQDIIQRQAVFNSAMKTFHKRWGISGQADVFYTSRQGFYSMELVNVVYFTSINP